MKIGKLLCLAACGVAAAISLPATHAQNYPNRPIRIIAQFTPGTSTDILARVIGGKLTETWGQQVVVDNRPGAGGLVGTELGAKETADGGAGFRAPWRVDATRERAVARQL